jgi:hypothetical protein
MMTGGFKLLDRIRQPAYTGKNRCLPCTVVNVVFAVTLAIGVGFVWLPAGLVTLVASLIAIALRGYLIPGTPTLTKRYLPGKILRWFGKDPAAATPTSGRSEHPRPSAESGEVNDERTEGTEHRARSPADPESILWEADILDEGADDIEIAPWFRDEFCEAASEVHDDDPEELVTTVLNADGAEVESFGQQISASVDGQEAGSWISRAALVADVATNEVLADTVTSWNQLDVETRFRTLSACRNVLDVCPLCDGHVRPSEEPVDSCCFDALVISVRCQECDALFFEATQGL